jgi:RNA polymerase sigma-70 factor (ECF subfamily)
MVFDNDRALLDSFRRGEQRALTTVFSTYVDEVATLVQRGFTMSVSRVVVPGERDLHRQRDLVQETFVRAFSERARLAYDGISPFRPWLLRIAKNLMIDEGRRAGRLVATPAVDVDLAQVNDVSPEDELEWKTLRGATVAWKATLDAETLRFVQLRFEDEHSQAEVAAAMKVTRRRIRTLEQVVRDALRRWLVERGLL